MRQHKFTTPKWNDILQVPGETGLSPSTSRGVAVRGRVCCDCSFYLLHLRQHKLSAKIYKNKYTHTPTHTHISRQGNNAANGIKRSIKMYYEHKENCFDEISMSSQAILSLSLSPFAFMVTFSSKLCNK